MLLLLLLLHSTESRIYRCAVQSNLLASINSLSVFIAVALMMTSCAVSANATGTVKHDRPTHTRMMLSASVDYVTSRSIMF